MRSGERRPSCDTRHLSVYSKLLFLFYDLLTNDVISGRVDRSSATKTVDLGLILDWVKPKTLKIGIHSFPD